MNKKTKRIGCFIFFNFSPCLVVSISFGKFKAICRVYCTLLQASNFSCHKRLRQKFGLATNDPRQTTADVRKLKSSVDVNRAKRALRLTHSW